MLESVDAALVHLENIISYDLINTCFIPQDVWDLRLFKRRPSVYQFLLRNLYGKLQLLSRGGPCDSWWSVVGGTNGWQLVANGRLTSASSCMQHQFEGQISSINIGIGIIGTDKKFRS
nr:hypothetical protein CFP56_70447 [Quercus suber]